MRLEGIQAGDIVEVDRLGRRFHALVSGNAPDGLSIQPLDRRVTYRSCRAHEVVAEEAAHDGGGVGGRAGADDQNRDRVPARLAEFVERVLGGRRGAKVHPATRVFQALRIAVNAAAARPLRLKAVEDAVRGKPPNSATGEMAGKLAVQGAVPLQFNAYKIPLMRNLVKRAIGGVEEATWAS